MNNRKDKNRELGCIHSNLVLIGQILTPDGILKGLYICETCRNTFIKDKGELLPMIPRYF